jgi:hypothetical protein
MNANWEKEWEEFRVAYVAWKTATQACYKAMKAFIEKDGSTKQGDVDHLIIKMEHCKLRFDAFFAT